MASAFTGNLRELKNLHKSGRLTDELALRYQNEFGSSSQSQINSWKNSIPYVLDVLKDSRFDEIQVLIEYQMPIGNERADMILLGGIKEMKKGIVIELKQQSSVDLNQFNRFGHPALQVLNYLGRVTRLHSLGEKYEFKPVLFIHNFSKSNKGEFYSGRFAELENKVITIYSEGLNNLGDICDEFLLPVNLDLEESSYFSKAPYKQSKTLFEFIQNHFKDIQTEAELNMASAGFGLTENQHDIIFKILKSLENNEEKIFLINGKPGSGKSLLGINLLISSLSKKRQSVFVARGNRFVPIIRQCLVNNIKEINGIVVYVDSRHGNNFIGKDSFQGGFDFVVCDEAQRFRKNNIKNIIKRAPVVVFFYDEQQILNPPEEGRRDSFIEAAFDSKKEIVELNLEYAVRCRGGEDYHTWIESLLNLENTIKPSAELKARWTDKYPLMVFDDIVNMRDRLREINEVDKKNVALVASFTESDGGTGNLLRVGYPMQSGFEIYKGEDIHINWLMQENEYKRFWLEGKSNELTHCASIYGSQGFESDYVGIIWGRDFVIRNGKWSKGEQPVSYDNIDGLSRVARNDLPQYLKLLQNRYRIFLTRGILGTFIFCEDNETREYLKEVIN